MTNTNNPEEKKTSITSRIIKTCCSCQSIACGGCLIILAVVAVIFFIVFSKPTSIWGRVINFMNNGVELRQIEIDSSAEVRSDLNSQFSSIGENEIEVSEDQITSLVRESLPQLTDSIAEVTEDSLRIYWTLENSIPDQPLYGVLELKINDKNEIYIDHLGTERLSLPQFVSTTASNLLLSLQNTEFNKDDKFFYAYALLAPDKNLKITDINFEEDKILLTVSFNADIF